ncbi:MAG: 2Fe-2S iron-sulfur cluster-binding protein [Spongiibacteraceae bacterium]
MPVVKFVNHDGTINEVEVTAGASLMQAAVDNGIDSIIAECGGACSCATCHCYIDDAWVEAVGQPGETEKDMLECVIDPQPNSRLSCQVHITDELDGLVVKLPESQY